MKATTLLHCYIVSLFPHPSSLPKGEGNSPTVEQSQRGFTIIELLIAIAVLAGLISALLVLIDIPGQFKKARDAQRKSDLGQIQKVLEQYYQDKGKYPAHNSNFEIDDPVGTARTWGNPWTPYINVLPKDPKTTSPAQKYVYFRTTNGQSYFLYASLERGGSDAQACFSNGNACASAVTNSVSTACGGPAGTVCNYGASSPDQSP